MKFLGYALLALFSFTMVSCSNREGEIIELLNAIKSQNESLKTQIAAVKKTADSALVVAVQTNLSLTATNKKIDAIQVQLQSIISQIALLNTQLTQTGADVVYIKTKLDELQKKCAELIEILSFENSTSLKSGLIAYYSFDGNANDLSGNSYHGTVTNAILSTDRFGNKNSSYKFERSKIDVGVLPKLGNSPTQITQSAWILAPTDQSNYCKLPIMSKRQIQDYSSSWISLGGGGNGTINAPWVGQAYQLVNIHFYGAGITTANVSTSKTTDGKWHLITGVRDGNIFRLYFDGVLQETHVDNNQIFSDNVMTIGFEGCWGFDCERYFVGEIDDVGIWNRPLTDKEVAYLYKYAYKP